MFKMDVIYIVPPSLGIRFIVDIYFFYRMWKQSSSLHLVSALEIERLLKIFVMSMVFFLLIYNKRQTRLLLDCECSHVPLRLPVPWVLGSDRAVMGCPVRLQFRCGPPSLSPSLPCSWSCGLPAPSGCHPVLLHCWAQGQLQRDLFQPCRGALLASWESPSIFFFFFFDVSSHALCHKNRSTCWNALHVSQRLWAAVQELRSPCLEGMVSVTCGIL